ncbi:Pr Domain Zinc Finger Protein 14 [Manis pentadactyla]|nr:Pr Domain Zinc Finger Protein 14 [Manis pentadactyla]
MAESFLLMVKCPSRICAGTRLFGCQISILCLGSKYLKSTLKLCNKKGPMTILQKLLCRKDLGHQVIGGKGLSGWVEKK